MIKHTEPVPDPRAVNQDKKNMLFSVSFHPQTPPATVGFYSYLNTHKFLEESSYQIMIALTLALMVFGTGTTNVIINLTINPNSSLIIKSSW